MRERSKVIGGRIYDAAFKASVSLDGVISNFRQRFQRLRGPYKFFPAAHM
jgi:hypothetical protein